MSKNPENDRRFVFALLDTAARLERRLDRGVSHIAGVSFAEYQLLMALQGMREAKATRVDLAQKVGMTPSGVTRALKPLEKIGFVKTTKDARDARRSLATLTPAGVTLLSDTTGIVNDVIADMPAFDSLRAADRDHTVQILATFVQD